MKKVTPHKVDWAQIERFLASADKKLASARRILAFDEEACLQQAYEAMLKASIGFMFSHGFRARSQPGHHVAIIEFVRQHIDKKHAMPILNDSRLRFENGPAEVRGSLASAETRIASSQVPRQMDRFIGTFLAPRMSVGSLPNITL